MGNEYRPQSKDRSTFKEYNKGDGGLSQLRQRDAKVVQGMQDLRDQTAEIGNDQIAGIRRANAIELQNRADIKATVEDGAYQTKRKAIETNSRREVEALEQKGKEYGAKAAMWGQLTPHMAQGFESLANSYYEQAENKHIATAHETQTDTAKIFARVTNEALTAAELDVLVESHAALKESQNSGWALRLSGQSAWLSVGRHDVHARREKGNVADYWTQFTNALKREGVEIDSTNIGQHVDNFRAIILKSNGWTNSKSQGVLELNEVITKLKTSKTKEHILSENTREGDRQYKTAYDIVTSTSLKATGINSLVQRKMLTLKDGKLPNMAEAIEMVFVEDLAKDLDVPLADIYAALDFETPEEGRQAKYPTYGTRNASLKEKIRKARAEVGDTERKLKDKENKYADSVEKEKAKEWLSHTGSYESGGENEGKGWSGDGDERQARIDIAKQNGWTETVTLLESYAPFDETQYTKGLMLDNIGELVDAGEHEQAMNLIENSPLLTTDDRNKAKAKYLPVLQHFAQAGTSEKKIEDTLESLLLTRIGGTYVGNEGKTNIPSLEGAIGGGKAYLMERFRHYDKLQPDTQAGYTEALRLAWGDTKEIIEGGTEGFAHITEGKDSNTDVSYFSKYQPAVDAAAIKSNDELMSALKSSPIVKDNDGNITSLGAWETTEILSTPYLHSIAKDLNEGRPIVVPGMVLEESIRSGVPVDILVNAQLGQKRKHKGKEGSFSQKMRPGPRDIAMQGVFPGYMNVKDRIAHAHGLLTVQNLVNFTDTGGNQNLANRDEAVNNATQFTPEQLTYIETEVQKAKDRSGKEEIIVNGNTKFKWAEIKSVCQECNLEDIDFSNVVNNRYRFKPGTKSEGYILEAMGRGLLTGVYFNPVTQELIMEDD